MENWCPPKVKNFIWRVAMNCLPTRDHLRRIHVDVDSICLICMIDQESIFHVLISYPLARKW